MSATSDRFELTDDGLRARVAELVPRLRERAATAEHDRRLPAESIEEMLAAGLARILVPRRFGGAELGLETWLDVVLELSRADASHGWCASLLIHHPHYVAQFPEAAQLTVWADGPDVAVAASIMPLCEVVKVDGGFRLSGRAPFASGIDASSWAILGGVLPEPGPPQWCLFLIGPGDYEVEETWFTTGMRGTGSNTVITDGAFVPAERVLRQSDLRDGTSPGGRLHDDPIYRAPWYSYAPLAFVTPMIGAAQGAYEDFCEWTGRRRAAGGVSVADHPSVQTRLGQAAATLDAAELLVRRAAEVPRREPVSPRLKARSIRDCARAAELVRDAVDGLMQMSGMHGFAAGNPIHRAWADVHFAASHVSLNPDVDFAYWARTEFGRDHPESVVF